MTGKERFLTALSVKQPDRVPLYIHGINEEPIIGIGRHLTDGLPKPRGFHEMNDSEKMKLLDTLFLLHEEFEVDGFTAFEIGHEVPVDEKRVVDDWQVVYTRTPHGLPVPTGHPISTMAALNEYTPPDPNPNHLLMLSLARDRFAEKKALVWMMRGTFVRSWRLAGMHLKKVKDYCGDRICLMGNIDCVELLPDGTPEQVDAAVHQAIEDAGAGGGLIICSSNSLHPGVNPENCIAMFEATKRYGICG